MKRGLAALLSLTLGLLTKIAVAAPITLTSIKVSSLSNYSRVVFTANGNFRYNHFTLTKPDRLVIDVQQARLAAKTTDLNLATTPIQAIRSYQHQQQGYLRIVLDLKKAVKSTVFNLPATRLSPHRLVIDLQTSTALAANTTTTQPTLVLTKRQNLRNIVIVIDPGHGGKDPGATGRGGHREKSIVLAISKDLQQLLNQQPGFNAKLTRSGDYFVPLGDRLRIARRDKADLFIAIHADADQNRYAQGASIYALSDRGATSVAAKWLAQRENESELMGGTTLNDKDQMVRSVLINLSQNYSISVSLKIGVAMLRQLSKFTLLHYYRIEQAGFMVLKSDLDQIGARLDERDARSFRQQRGTDRGRNGIAGRAVARSCSS